MLIVALVVLYVTTVDGDCCKDNWIKFENSCYLFVGTKETWMEASQLCAARGATLAAIETAAENTFLTGYLKVFGAFGGALNTWIGGNDMEIEGQWKWSPSGELVTYTSWYPGEPDGNADCVVIWADYHYNWADHSCHYQESFFCEMAIMTDQVIG